MESQQRGMKEFSLKFADVMVGIILGLGFQWWVNLHETWQYIAFVFIYLNLIDYWVDYSPLLKRYPFKRETDVMIHFVIIFLMFYLVYATQKSIVQLLVAFALYRLIDVIWIWRIKSTYDVAAHDRKFFSSWTRFELIECIGAIILAGILIMLHSSPLIGLIIFIILRIIMRVAASATYNSVYYETARK